MRLDWIFLPKENPCAKFYIIIIIIIRVYKQRPVRSNVGLQMMLVELAPLWKLGRGGMFLAPLGKIAHSCICVSIIYYYLFRPDVQNVPIKYRNDSNISHFYLGFSILSGTNPKILPPKHKTSTPVNFFF